MTATLASFLLRSHGGHTWPVPGVPIEWRPDHVLLDDADGTAAALAFEASGARRATCELVLVAPQREAAGPDGLADLRFLQSFASATGAHFARPGTGMAGAIHRRRFATPGRVLASSVPGAGAAGALAMLVLPACALERAAAMTGEPLLLPRPRVVGVEVTGVTDPGISGFDVLIAVERRLSGEGTGAILEFFGLGLFSLSMADRFGIAMRAGAVTGALAVLFPSDDRTRLWLRECGRDADWRRLEGGVEGFDSVVALELSSVRAERSDGTAVRVGVYADDDDVHALARVLARVPRSTNVGLEAVVPGRLSLAAWTAAGTLAALRAAGATILDRAVPGATSTPPGAVLVGGDPETEAIRERGVWSAAALLTGGTAAETMVSAGARGPVPLPEWDDVIEPAGGEIEHGAHHRPPPLAPVMRAAVRVVVLLEAGDDATAARLLPWGPRAWAARADTAELAGALFRSIDPDAAARARALGATVVVAAEAYGGGRHSEAVARATAALGVRAVIASSYGGGHDRLLALHGVLPLTWIEPGDRLEVKAGDELEIPPPSPGQPRGGRVPVRHLTRGFTFEVRCELEVVLREIARTGGLPRALRAAMTAGGVEG